jgi:HNH endonuclease
MIEQTTLHHLLDYDSVTGLFKWRQDRTGGIKRGDIAGCLDKDGYVVIAILGKQYRAHRLAWLFVHGTWCLLDHIDGVRSNNRLINLEKRLTHKTAQTSE